MVGRTQILYVIGSLERGGAETHLLRVLPRLAARAWPVAVFTVAEAGEMAPELEANGVPVIRPWIAAKPGSGRLWRLARLMLVALQLWLYLLRWRPALVHSFLPASYLIALPVAKLAFISRFVMSRRSLALYQQKRATLAQLERRYHCLPDVLLGNSQSVVTELVAESGRPDACRLIYNGIDTTPSLPNRDMARAALRTALGLPDDAIVGVVTANLIPYKGHADLVAALALLREAKPALATRLVILCVGRDDGIGSELITKTEAAGLKANMRLLGARSDVPEILAGADLGLLVSHEEGFPNAILEYMAAGLPVLATAAGGSTEAVVDGETGLLVPPRDPVALSAALAMLALDAGARSVLGAAGRTRCVNEFSLERCVNEYDALYRELLPPH